MADQARPREHVDAQGLSLRRHSVDDAAAIASSMSPPTPLAPKPDPLWSQPCLAYKLHAELSAECRTRFAQVQESLRGAAPALLVCPPASFHVSVATFLSVREDYQLPKDVIWARWGEKWTSGVRELVGRLAPFEISFTRVGVSDAAVVALAEPVDEIELLRARVDELRAQAAVYGPQPSIVHSTLLRYATAHMDLRGLAQVGESIDLQARTVVTSLVVTRELVYPNLVTEQLERLHFGRGRP